MLWQKGWFETRFRLLFVLGMMAFLFSVQYSVKGPSVPTPNATRHANAIVLGSITFADIIPVIMLCSMLGGAGIQTQPSFQASKGVHGSSLFTLSLPVSRLRLLAVRAAIGWLEAAAGIVVLCVGSWLVSPVLRTMSTPAEMAEYGLTLLACGTALYCLSVLLATFLDDQWRTWGTMLGAGALWWLSRYVSLPPSIDIVRAIGKGSPIIAHTIPWSAMAFSLILAAAFFYAALTVAQSREY